MIRTLARLELRPVLNVGACGNLLPRRGVLRLEDQGAVVGGHRPMCKGLQRLGGTGQQFGSPLSARCAGRLRAYCAADNSLILSNRENYTIPLLLAWKPNSLVGHGSSPGILSI